MATDFDFTPAEKKMFYFIGVTTQNSSIMKVFPKWAEYLRLGDCSIVGINCEHHDNPDVYKKVVKFIKEDRLSLGALVTTHKLDLLKASGPMFDYLDPYAKQLEEISCISKRDNRLHGHAKDPITSGLAYEAIIPKDYYKKNEDAEIFILGAGGSSLALTIYLMKKTMEQRPAKIIVSNRSSKRLEEMKNIHANMDCPIPIEYKLCPIAEDNDRVVNELTSGSIIINATGLGKDAPGSPLTNVVVFPIDSIIWDFNYRGELIFLEQANNQKDSKNLSINDGWVYFIHGWTSVIAEVFNIDIPSRGPVFDKLGEIAASTRK